MHKCNTSIKSYVLELTELDFSVLIFRLQIWRRFPSANAQTAFLGEFDWEKSIREIWNRTTSKSSRANLIFCCMPERTTPAEEKYRLGTAALWGK